MSKLETNTIDTVSGTSNLVIGSTNSSTVTFENGAVTGHNYPAFEAYLSSTQSVTNDVTTKIQIDTEVLDTDNCYDNSTNYRFTPTVAGKYFVYAYARCQSSADNLLRDINLSVYKNGSLLSKTVWLLRTNYERAATPSIFNIVDMNGSSDYVEFYGKITQPSGTPDGFIGTAFRETIFGAYRIGS